MAKYLDDNGLLYVWGKIKTLLATKQNTLRAGDHISISADTISAVYDNATQSKAGLMSAADKIKLAEVNDVISTKSNIDSPAFTGTPLAPTAAEGTKTKQIATTEFVSSAVAAALAKITGIKFEVVTELPASGVDGVFYLLSHTHSDENDSYDEYVWLSGKSKYEKIGNTDVDLSGYIKSSDISAIANTDVDTICA